MRRICSIAVIGTLLLASSALAGKSSFDVASSAIPSAEKASQVIVPITISYDANLTALDIPLKYSEGVTLTEVTFGEMLEGYDFKTANIMAESNTVIIGAINMVFGSKPDLEAGSGVVANLHFTVNDASVKSIRIEKVQLSDPDHDLYFVYNRYDENNVPHVVLETLEFQPIEVALSGSASTDPLVPKEFALGQNYPNPFNPNTKINISLPKASEYTLTIYNVSGQKVLEINGEDVARVVTLDVDMSAYASGIYFYKVKAGSYTATRKMALVK